MSLKISLISDNCFGTYWLTLMFFCLFSASLLGDRLNARSLISLSKYSRTVTPRRLSMKPLNRDTEKFWGKKYFLKHLNNVNKASWYQITYCKTFHCVCYCNFLDFTNLFFFIVTYVKTGTKILLYFDRMTEVTETKMPVSISQNNSIFWH